MRYLLALVVVKRTRQQRRAWIEDLHASADFTEFESNERSALVRNIQVQSDQRIGNGELSHLPNVASLLDISQCY